MNDSRKVAEEHLAFLKYCIWIAFGCRSKTPIPQYLGVAAEAFIKCVNRHKQGMANIRTYSRTAVVGSVRLAYFRERCIVRPPSNKPTTPVLKKRAEQAAAGWVSIFERLVDRRSSRSVDELTSAEHDAGFPVFLSELCDAMDYALQLIPEREREVVSLRFGLYDGRTKTLGEVGKVIGLSPERVRQIEMRGVRKLQQPSVCKHLVKFLGY